MTYSWPRRAGSNNYVPQRDDNPATSTFIRPNNSIGSISAGTSQQRIVGNEQVSSYVPDDFHLRDVQVEGSITATGFMRYFRQTSLPSVMANSGSVFTREVSGITELFYRDSEGNLTQITSGGSIGTDSLIGTSLTLIGSMPYIQSVDGSSTPVSGPNTGRIRYNNTTGTFQISTQGGNYEDILTGSGGVPDLDILQVTANYTITGVDAVILCNSSNAIRLTLPEASTVDGRIIRIKNINTGEVTVDGYENETIDDGATAVLSDKYEAITIISDGTEWFVL